MKRVFLYLLIALTALLAAAAYVEPRALWAFVILGPVLLLTAYDMLQKRHTILRNYPLIGHVRYILEDARHHIRQYLIQGDKEGDPFTRPQRAVVYQRAKNVSDVQPFGSLQDMYSEGHEWMQHSIAPVDIDDDDPRVVFGNEACTQPYNASLLNISAMSFGSLSANAILALNGGARQGGFAHDTGEGGLSEFHLAPGGDLIWEIGTGYFGCRTADGDFDPEQFRDKAAIDQVRMLELKLSQGAKPGGGGILPGAKVTPEIARARGVPEGKSVHSPARHKVFSTPIEMMEFIQRMRELGGGKPVGFKLCIGRHSQFMALCKAMLETGIAPDFITIDGAEGGTGAAPVELTDRVGEPLREGLMFAHNALVGAGLRNRVRLIACGKIINGYDMASRMAIGADTVSSARGMMFALGCIQARRCHANTCPTGVATQDPWRSSGLVVSDKTQRVANFHHNTIKHLLKIQSACGIQHAADLNPGHLMRRVSPTLVNSYEDLFPWLEPNALAEGGDVPVMYARAWSQGNPTSFG
ncbi:MAG: FMN-binding glutamate synthase family protein [Pseudomonadota bacterium]